MCWLVTRESKMTRWLAILAESRLSHESLPVSHFFDSIWLLRKFQNFWEKMRSFFNFGKKLFCILCKNYYSCPTKQIPTYLSFMSFLRVVLASKEGWKIQRNPVLSQIWLTFDSRVWLTSTRESNSRVWLVSQLASHDFGQWVSESLTREPSRVAHHYLWRRFTRFSRLFIYLLLQRL